MSGETPAKWWPDWVDDIEDRTERRAYLDHYKRKWIEDPANGITPDPRTRARWDLDDLRGEVERAGVLLDDWPYSNDTAAGIEANIAHRSALARVKRSAGDLAAARWQLDRERDLWSRDARNPRNRDATPPDAPTDYAREKIAEIRSQYPMVRRSVKNGRVSRVMMARRVGVDRDSITDWERRGYMTWPPVEENPQA